MKEALITVVILFLFYTAVHVYIKITDKKAKQENEQPRKVQFNAEFFGYANFLTLILVVTVVDNIIQFVFVCLYLIGIVYSADKVHKKHLKQERKTNLK